MCPKHCGNVLHWPVDMSFTELCWAWSEVCLLNCGVISFVSICVAQTNCSWSFCFQFLSFLFGCFLFLYTWFHHITKKKYFLIFTYTYCCDYQNRRNRVHYFINKNLLLQFWVETASIGCSIAEVKNRSNTLLQKLRFVDADCSTPSNKRWVGIFFPCYVVAFRRRE